MSRLEELIAELCPDGLAYVELGEVIKFINGRAYKQEELLQEGTYKVLRVGNFFTNESWYYSDMELENDKYCFDGDLLYAWAASIGPQIWKGEKTIFHYHIWKLVFDETVINKQYLFHLLKKDVDSIRNSLTNSTMPHVSMKNMMKRTLQLPPLPVQREIVRILDNFTELTAKLTAELTARKKQYEYYRDELFKSKHWMNVPLGNVCSLITKGTTPKSYQASGIRFIKTESFLNNVISNNKTAFISEATHIGPLKRSILQEKDILFTIAGATIGKCASVEYNNLPANTNQALAIIRLNRDIVNQRFIFYILQSNRMSEYIRTKVKGSAQPNLNLRQMNEFIIPVPSLEDQERIVNILDRFDTLTNDLSSGLPAEIEARRKQYEYYRDKLLTFKEKSS